MWKPRVDKIMVLAYKGSTPTKPIVPLSPKRETSDIIIDQGTLFVGMPYRLSDLMGRYDIRQANGTVVVCDDEFYYFMVRKNGWLRLRYTSPNERDIFDLEETQRLERLGNEEQLRRGSRWNVL